MAQPVDYFSLLAKELRRPAEFFGAMDEAVTALEKTEDYSDEALHALLRPLVGLTRHLVAFINLLRLLSEPYHAPPAAEDAARGPGARSAPKDPHLALDARATESLLDRHIQPGVSVTRNTIQNMTLGPERRQVSMTVNRVADGGDLEEEEERVRKEVRRAEKTYGLPGWQQRAAASTPGGASPAAPPRPKVITRLLDPHRVTLFPEMKQYVSAFVTPAQAAAMTHEDYVRMRARGLGLLELLREQFLVGKEKAHTLAARLAEFLVGLPKGSHVVLSKTALQVFGQERVPSLLTFYQLLAQLNCFRSIYLSEAGLGRVLARVEYDRAAVEAPEAGLYHPLSPFPRYAMHLVLHGVQTLTFGNKLAYNRPETAKDLHSFALVCARVLFCEAAPMRRTLFHSTLLRLALFHVHSLRCFLYLGNELRFTARLCDETGHPLDAARPAPATPDERATSPEWTSLFISILRDSNRTFDNDSLLQSNQVNLFNYIQQEPGAEQLEHELRPFFTAHAVKVTDSASLTLFRLYTKFLESNTFSKYLGEPTLLMQPGVPEEELRLAQCLVYLFMLDFHLCAHYQSPTSDTNSLEGRYMNTHVAIFPKTLDETCLGGVVLAGRRFYVYTERGLVDPGNVPSVLLTLVMDTLAHHSTVFGTPMRAIRRTIATSTTRARHGERLDTKYQLVEVR